MSLQKQKKPRFLAAFLKDGTSGRTRTGTPAKAGDFESPVSTNFTTLAQGLSVCGPGGHPKSRPRLYQRYWRRQ